MRFDILTILPGMFDGPFRESIIKRAIDRGLIEIGIHNIRDFATDRHRSTDDYPYGGGAGMVMLSGPIFAAAEHAIAEADALRPHPRRSIILTTPQGRLLNQRIVEELATLDHLVIVCGHYEGVDERVQEHLATDEISIGDYVLTGGEIPAMVIVDAVSRLVPGVVGQPASLAEESLTSGLLEYPHYTRPAEFRGWTVPEILLSGNHAAIARWRRQQALRRTWERRPDLLATAPLTPADRRFLEELRAESAPRSMAPSASRVTDGDAER
ncbi:MAG: tRNA (guanosine(37)-N1)-methyltransferase TrmD [Chloroflexi bacterium]|nr:tRNA (guanosine(37)-N1)-methyltransferase TrmD [Chloroflexota bacterium]